MTLDPDLLLKTLNFALAVGAIVYAWFASRRKDVDQRFQEGSRRMDRHETRLLTLEQQLQASPGLAEMHSLELQLAAMNGRLAEMGALMTGNAKIMERLEAIVSRHEDHLLDGGKR